MTVADGRSSNAYDEIVVKDSDGPLAFRGELVADLSWDAKRAKGFDHVRWTNLTLYRVREEGSEYTYVLQVVGRSVIYHRAGGPCWSGIYLPVGVVLRDVERYQELVACSTCTPEELDYLHHNTVVAVEEDLPTLYRCRDAAEFVDVMRSRIDRERSKAGLSMKLLKVASSVDPDIAAAQVKTRRL